MWTVADALNRLILVSAVLLTLNFAIAGVYPFAIGFGLLLLVYAYLVCFGDRAIEDRLLSPPR